jgi:hypothetical protein
MSTRKPKPLTLPVTTRTGRQLLVDLKLGEPGARTQVERALRKAGGRFAEACRLLGISVKAMQVLRRDDPDFNGLVNRVVKKLGGPFTGFPKGWRRAYPSGPVLRGRA